MISSPWSRATTYQIVTPSDGRCSSYAPGSGHPQGTGRPASARANRAGERSPADAHRTGSGSASISCQTLPEKRTWRSLTDSPRLSELAARYRQRPVPRPRVGLGARPRHALPSRTSARSASSSARGTVTISDAPAVTRSSLRSTTLAAESSSGTSRQREPASPPRGLTCPLER
jgi:hypothetical protein